MWKKEDAKTPGVSEISTGSAGPSAVPAVSPISSSPREPVTPLPLSPRSAACISQGIKIKGEVTGSEDLFVDGHVDGKLNLANGSLTVGPNGSVKADVTAREVIVRGKLEGRISGRDKVQLWSTGQVNGEIQTDRLSIEDGALMHGKVEAGKQPGKSAEARAASMSSGGSSSNKSPTAMPANSGTVAD